MAKSSQFSPYKTVIPTPVSPPTPIPIANRLDPVLATPAELIQATESIPKEFIAQNLEQALSSTINLNPATNFTADHTDDHANVEQLSTLLSIEHAISITQNSKAGTVNQYPGVVRTLNTTQYGTILRFIVLDLSSRFGITIDPTKLIYKMIEGKITANAEQTSGIEFSTTGTVDFLRMRLYFSFKEMTDLKFEKIYHDQNYTNENNASSIIYIYEGSVDKNDFRQFIEILGTPIYQEGLPSNTTALIPETGSIPMFLAEDMVPIVLEH